MNGYFFVHSFMFIIHIYRISINQFYYLQKLEQDDDDVYLNSTWADSSSMRRHVHGIDDVKFKFGGQ